MIERFGLPEGSLSIEDSIGEPRTVALDGARDFAERLMGAQEDMDVVRHERPGEEFVQLPLVFRDEQGVYYGFGYFWIFKPVRARGLIKETVHRGELLALGG